MSKVAIIIPCYNEEKRLSSLAYNTFLSAQPDADIFFVNDGSADKTNLLLTEIATNTSGRTSVINLTKNIGKAGAVREGLRTALNTGDYEYIGYLDADLSTTLEEFYQLFKILSSSNADFIFGSRIKMLDTNIERSAFRHIAGRCIATLIDSRLNLGIYDTQCGAKCFKKQIVEVFSEKPFNTRWLFDIEIFIRIKKSIPTAIGIEKPLTKWKDRAGSKINILNFPSITKEIFSLFTNYTRS